MSIVRTDTCPVLGYVYDCVGNRTNRFGSGTATNLLHAATNSFNANDWIGTDTYDSNGNTKVGQASSPVSGALNCSYDFENRLTHVTNGLSATIEIVYDGDGNRVRKTVTTSTSTNTAYYLVDDLNPTGYAQVLEELSPTNSQTSGLAVMRAYVCGHMLVSQTIFDPATHLQSSTSFYGFDGHNNVRCLTDGSGVVTDTYDYDAFGNLIAQVGSTSNSYLFTGEQFDSDLGLYFLRARYHDPNTSRFWTMDPYEGSAYDPVSLHKYTYCANDPAGCYNPSGRLTLVEVNVALGIAGAVINFWEAGQSARHGHYGDAALHVAFGSLGLFGGALGLLGGGGGAAGGGAAALSSVAYQLVGTAAGVVSAGGTALDARSLAYLWTFNMSSSGSGAWLRSSSGGPPNPNDTAEVRRKIFDVLQDKLADTLAALRQVDPDVQLGLRGSTISGKSAETGELWDPQSFDLDIYVKSDKFAGQYINLDSLFKQLKSELPDLFDGLYKASVKTYPQSSGLGADAVNF